MQTDTYKLAKVMLEKNVLNEPTFSFAELCQIRDALMILARYGLADMDLLKEVNLYLRQIQDNK